MTPACVRGEQRLWVAHPLLDLPVRRGLAGYRGHVHLHVSKAQDQPKEARPKARPAEREPGAQAGAAGTEGRAPRMASPESQESASCATTGASPSRPPHRHSRHGSPPAPPPPTAPARAPAPPAHSCAPPPLQARLRASWMGCWLPCDRTPRGRRKRWEREVRCATVGRCWPSSPGDRPGEMWSTYRGASRRSHGAITHHHAITA